MSQEMYDRLPSEKRALIDAAGSIPEGAGAELVVPMRLIEDVGRALYGWGADEPNEATGYIAVYEATKVAAALHAAGYRKPETTHLRPDTTERLLAWIDRRLADIESDLGDDETLQSLGLHGRVKLHERRDTLKFMRAQIEQDR